MRSSKNEISALRSEIFAFTVSIAERMALRAILFFQTHLNSTQSQLVLVQIHREINVLQMQKYTSSVMVRNRLRDCLMKSRTRRACRQRPEKSLHEYQTSCVVMWRGDEEARKRKR